MIKAVLFDLGETLVNFGRVNTTRVFRQGARASYDFLKSCGQPIGNFKWYFWRNLISLRIRYWLSDITGKDFDARYNGCLRLFRWSWYVVQHTVNAVSHFEIVLFGFDVYVTGATSECFGYKVLHVPDNGPFFTNFVAFTFFAVIFKVKGAQTVRA